jgi:hypothetical protein
MAAKLGIADRQLSSGKTSKADALERENLEIWRSREIELGFRRMDLGSYFAQIHVGHTGRYATAFAKCTISEVDESRP